MTAFVRNYPLEDITIRSGGDGRTVEAYAAVFNVDTEIHDHQGQYLERISPQAFNRTIAHRGTSFGVFYNHGLTLQGTPSERASLPIGTPEEVRADSRGLYTVTRYNNTPLADEVLEAIRTQHAGRFDAFGLACSQDLKQSLLSQPLSEAERATWQAQAQASLAEQAQIEAADTLDFEAFRQRYVDPAGLTVQAA